LAGKREKLFFRPARKKLICANGLANELKRFFRAWQFAEIPFMLNIEKMRCLGKDVDQIERKNETT